MFTPKFIRNISFDGERLRAIGRSGKETSVFVGQGDLDGSCCIYSLMMLLILNKKLDKLDLIDKKRGIGDNFVYSIQHMFLEKFNGMCKGGHKMKDISNRLNICFNAKLSESFTIKQGKRNTVLRPELHKMIKFHLDKGRPVMIGFKMEKGFGHAAVAIGYKMQGKKKMSIFCLDPGRPLGYMQVWNNVIDLDYYQLFDYVYTDYNYYAESKIIVDEILIINDPPQEDLPFKQESNKIPF